LRVSGQYVLRRTIYATVTLFAVTCINFAIPRLMPGNALYYFANPRIIATPGALEALKIRFGLDQPLWTQFVLYWVNLFSLPPNFGVSYLFYPAPVFSVIMQYLPWTLFLVGTATILTAIVGILLGVWTGSRPGSKLDTASVSISMILWTMPFFWLGIILLWVFAISVPWFPVSGALSAGLTANNPLEVHDIGDLLWHAFLPMVTLVTAAYAGYSLIMRNTMVNELSQDYVLLARAKGLRENAVLFGHAARNAMLPMITLIGLNLGYVVSGALLVEIVFSYPGVGLLTYRAVLAHDYPLLQGLFFIISLTVVVANYLADITYALLDPRIKY
jgi:peptide/nickel transport system permease protein